MNKYLYILLLMQIFLFAVMPADAQTKKKKKNKEKKIEVVADFNPDPIAHKARPDRHPKPLEQPIIFGHSTVGESIHGIDVSHYQGRINWDEVAKDPKAQYVYLKATEGTRLTDDTYSRNFAECKRVGLKVGSYMFFRPQYPAKSQFDLFTAVVDTRRQDLIPLVDVETIKGVSVATFQSRLLELCELLEKEYGRKPLIYTGQNFYNKYIASSSKLKAYKFFIAKYDTTPPILNDGNDYLMWQYSARGSVRGIRGHVDMSHFMGRHTLREILYKP